MLQTSTQLEDQQEQEHAELENCYHQSHSSITTQQQQQQQRMLKLNSFTNYHQQTDNKLNCHNRSKTPINELLPPQSSSFKQNEEHFPTSQQTLQLMSRRRASCEEAINSVELSSALTQTIRENNRNETRGPTETAGDAHNEHRNETVMADNPTTTCHYHQHGHMHYQQLTSLQQNVGQTKHALANFYRSQGSLASACNSDPAQGECIFIIKVILILEYMCIFKLA